MRSSKAAAALLAAALLLLLAGGLLAWGLLPPSWARGLAGSVDATAALIRSWGSWGVLGSIALMVVHSFLPFPAEIIACANGMLYGPLWGSVITWTGAMLGASVAFGLGRLLGRPFIRYFLSSGRQGRLAAWSRYSGGGALLISRLIPVIAFNVINYAAALTSISWWTFLWATALGILPLTILLAVLGDQMLEMPLWAWLLSGAVAILSWLILKPGSAKMPARDHAGTPADRSSE
ncbi:MAG TPA: TVP38/TMEM64 family protein [Burkholderiales bacterium]|nr:TVP38/TMEM64 family protein [Burkholderiales bacterium]